MSDHEHSTSSSSSDSSAPAPSPAGASAGKRQPTGLSRVLLVVLALLAIILAAALYEQNRQYQTLQADLQKQHASNTQLIAQARDQAAQALALAQAQTAKVDDMRSVLEATSNQVQELDQALQLMTDSGSDLLLLNDIDHLVTMAQQQLALGGNVANAIISLEAAQAQLARANRPNLAALQQTINGDLDRLRAVATINLPALSAQINQLSGLVGSAPLLVPDTAAQAAPEPVAQAAVAPEAAAAEVTSGWRAAADEAWRWTRAFTQQVAHDLRGLMDVRRVDDSAALLMSPDQALRFREGLKQRAVTAQLALMMHQSDIWKAELERIASAIEQRYDMRAESSRQALKIARSLHDTPIEVSLPSVNNSLTAIAAARDAEAAQEDDAPDEDEQQAPDAAPQEEADPPSSGVLPSVQAPAGAGTV
ncbi:uroporphyrinogen-III C-methyltransferase [Castellaniella caeni]|uniref:uroporphyrinogen-III C-methyltransferase n=1 Tax=Castellaniella caeni TaxID=266123 RepID=UPI000C9F4A73|nr:uroporphyrinogen-III C-methyltransferase [Castellaniella caeni]